MDEKLQGASGYFQDREAIGFVLALARALQRYGTPAHRLEEALVTACKQLGLERAEVFSSPTTLILSFGEPADLRTRMMRADPGELDFEKLERVDALASAVMARRMTIAEGTRLLQTIVDAPRTYGHVAHTLAHAVASGTVAVFFGGGTYDVATAGAIGLGLGLLAQVMKRSNAQARVYELVGATFAAFVAGAASTIAPVSAALVTIASMIVLLPGMSLVVAMTELATRNLISGTSRLMAAVIVLLELAVGVAVGERLASLVFDLPVVVPIPLPEWAQWVALGAAAIAMAVLVQAAHRAIGWIVAASIVGFVGARVGTTWLGGQLGVGIGAFALGCLANLFARLLDRPAQVVLIPATLLLVPGSMGFRGMSSLLERDTITGVETVFAMFVVAMAIVGGLLVANATVSPRRAL
jgi:uncharacterized membrane protein YjjP (DUF1212 family)